MNRERLATEPNQGTRMTAQAPYESLTTVEAIQKAQADGRTVELNRAPRWEETNLRDEKNIAAFLRIGAEFRAALPERAPVSAGGDDLMLVPRSVLMTAGTLLQQSANVIDRREGAALLSHARGSATPAPPVGADWVMVPREPTGTMLDAGIEEIDYDGNEVGDNVRNARLAMLAAAPTPADTRQAQAQGCEDLASWLRWVAGELVKRDTQGGTFAQGVAQSLCGRAYILEYVAHKKDAAHAQAVSCEFCGGRGFTDDGHVEWDGKIVSAPEDCVECDGRGTVPAAHAQAGEGSNNA